MWVNLFNQSQAPRLALEHGNRVVYSRLSQFENHRVHLGISLKYVVAGEEDYSLGPVRHRVKAGQYLLVNHQSELHTSITSETPVVGLCLYLRPELVAEVWRAQQGSPLDQPFDTTEMEPVFHEQVYEGRFTRPGQRLRRLAQRAALPFREIDLQEEFYYEAAFELLADQSSLQRTLARLDCVKHSTREELLRRLTLARNFIHDHIGDDLDLDRISREACLSKFHFIRLFKQAFGKTPHQYLISLRLEKARQLLRQSDAPLTEICLEIGLRDLSSFGRRFKRAYGLNPSEYRKAIA